MKNLLLSILLSSLFLPLKASYLLIPMDQEQTNHLKAYGIAFLALTQDIKVDWLLNYRG